MAKVPFPHILEQHGSGSEKTLRVVTDQDIDKGDYLVSKFRSEHNPKTGDVKGIYNVHDVLDVTEKRLAKGDWSAWPIHPYYYECRVKYIGERKEEEVQQYLPSQV